MITRELEMDWAGLGIHSGQESAIQGVSLQGNLQRHRGEAQLFDNKRIQKTFICP